MESIDSIREIGYFSEIGLDGWNTLQPKDSKHKQRNNNHIRKALISWYAENHRDLPWRHTQDPYCIWISEVMLQQTQVKTVLPYYGRFLKRFPDVTHLAKADLQQVLKVWEGLGYYGRARNLHRAAKQVVETHGRKVPESADAFRSLPGVGEYITSAVLSIAFERPHAVVDGNVKRVLARLFEIKAPVNKSGSYKEFKNTAQALLDADKPGLFNQAVMELGALVCKPRNPECAKCPLQSACMAYANRRMAEFPKRVRSKPTPTYHVTAGVVFKRGKLLITCRKPEGLLGGLWEFPGGNVASGERAEEACVREIKENVNLSVEVTGFLTRVNHAYTHFKIIMDVYCCRFVSGRVKLKNAVDFRWIRVKDIENYPFPKAHHKFFSFLEEKNTSC